MKKKKTLDRVWGVLEEDETTFCGFFKTVLDAKNYVQHNEKNGAKILEIVSVVEAYYPEEPEVEFVQVGLGNL